MFLVASACLMWYGVEWKRYDTFAKMTVGGSSTLKISKVVKDVSKYIKVKREDVDNG